LLQDAGATAHGGLSTEFITVTNPNLTFLGYLDDVAPVAAVENSFVNLSELEPDWTSSFPTDVLVSGPLFGNLGVGDVGIAPGLQGMGLQGTIQSQLSGEGAIAGNTVPERSERIVDGDGWSVVNATGEGEGHQ
jgi:hypothetical protein